MELSLEEWLKYGWDKGWCSPPACAMHDGTPMTEYELDWTDDTCVHVIRLYEDEEQRKLVERDHGPTNWRASNRGWKRDAE